MDLDNPTQWPVGTPVRLVKLSACDDAVVPPSTWEDWKMGELNTRSLPVDYELQGILVEPMETGKRICVLRTHRNGVRVDGVFQSSLVREFKNGAAITLNSVYFIQRDESLKPG